MNYSYGSSSWTIDCSDSQTTDVTLYSDGYVKSITLIDSGCGSSSSSITVHWIKWAVSSIGITNTLKITDSNNDTYKIYYYYTADSFDYVITNKASGKTINQVYFVESTSSTWGSDHLSTTIGYYESWTLQNIYPCGVSYDRKAVATDGTYWTTYDQYHTCWADNGINLLRSGRSHRTDLTFTDNSSSTQVIRNHFNSAKILNNDNNIKYNIHELPF